MDSCFAHDKKRCRILKIKECDGCSFYKTIEEVKEGRKKAIERIMSLDKVTRESIIRLYYDGQLEV